MYKTLQICFALLIVIPTSKILSSNLIKLIVKSEKKRVRLVGLTGFARLGGLVGAIALVRIVFQALKKYNNRPPADSSTGGLPTPPVPPSDLAEGERKS